MTRRRFAYLYALILGGATLVVCSVTVWMIAAAAVVRLVAGPGPYSGGPWWALVGVASVGSAVTCWLGMGGVDRLARAVADRDAGRGG